MTAIKTLKALSVAGGALALSAGVAQAQTPYYPSGSYGDAPNGSFTASCRNVQSMDNGYVSAECQTQGGYRWSAIRYVDCRGDIANRDGVLTCYGAQATVGPLYPEAVSAYPPQTYPEQQPGYPNQAVPGGVFGAILGAIFGNAIGNDNELERDWDRGRRGLGDRRASLEARIEAGVRDGSLTRREADSLRSDYYALVQLEARYQRDGRLSSREREDLRARYRALAERVRDERNDGQGYESGYGNWQRIADRSLAFDARVDAAVSTSRLSRREAAAVRGEFQQLVRLEGDYDRGGLDSRERDELNRRYEDLLRRVDGGRYDGGYPEPGYGDDRNDPARLEERIRGAERAGLISSSEAERLRAELEDLTRLEAAYAMDGLSQAERDYLDRRYAQFDERFRDYRR